MTKITRRADRISVRVVALAGLRRVLVRALQAALLRQQTSAPRVVRGAQAREEAREWAAALFHSKTSDRRKRAAALFRSHTSDLPMSVEARPVALPAGGSLSLHLVMPLRSTVPIPALRVAKDSPPPGF